MRVIIEFIYFFFTVALIENIVFTRGLGSSKSFKYLSNKKELLFYTLSLVIMLVPSTIIIYFAEKPFKMVHQTTKSVIIPVLVVLVVTLFYFLSSFIISFLKETKLKESFADLIPSTAYSYITLGTLFLASRQNLVLFQRLALVLGSAAGFLLATLLISFSQSYIESDKIPRVFKGLPIKVLFVGLLSLAFYGLSGHELSF